jgi:tRNA pseudouridine55 synthase
MKDVTNIAEEEIHKATLAFIGEIQQVPPIHSAIKQDGKPVYLMARKGIDVKMEARTITIKSFVIEKIELPVVHFKVICTTGTYIRSLANDFGKQLGCGAYLSSLRRTRIGEFLTEDALLMEQLVHKIKSEDLLERHTNT